MLGSRIAFASRLLDGSKRSGPWLKGLRNIATSAVPPRHVQVAQAKAVPSSAPIAQRKFTVPTVLSTSEANGLPVKDKENMELSKTTESRKRPISFAICHHDKGFTLHAVGFKLKQTEKNKICKIFNHDKKTWAIGTWQNAKSTTFKPEHLLHGLASHIKAYDGKSGALEVQIPENESHSVFSMAKRNAKCPLCLCKNDTGKEQTSLSLNCGVLEAEGKDVLDDEKEQPVQCPAFRKQDAQVVQHVQSVNEPPLMWLDGPSLKSRLKGDRPTINRFHQFNPLIGTVNKIFRR